LAFHIAFPNDEIVEQYTNHSQLFKNMSQVTTVHVFFHTNNECLKFIIVYATNLKKRRNLNGKTKRKKHAEHLDQV